MQFQKKMQGFFRKREPGPTYSYHVVKEFTLLKCKTIDVYTIKMKKNKSTAFQWFLFRSGFKASDQVQGQGVRPIGKAQHT
jgi:hypothetical protein